MKKIKLLGDIAEKYKADWLLEVDTASEALRAINANRPGFLAACDAGGYVAILIDESNPDAARQVTNECGLDAWGDEMLYVVPKISGNVTAAIIASITSGVISGTAATIVAIVVNMAISLAISAIASLIAGTPDGSGANEAPENKPSYIFNGVVNTSRQGGRIPVLYGGPLLVGSMVLSSRVNTQDIEL